MKPIIIVIQGTPLAWKAPYVGSRGAFSPRTPIMKQIREIIMQQFKDQHGAFMTPFQGAIGCDIFFYMPIPKATSQKRRRLMVAGEIRPITRPDRTNCAKFTEDCCNLITYLDDSQIVDGRVAKWYGEEPRTEIRIYPCC